MQNEQIKENWEEEFERVFHGKLIQPEYKSILRNFVSHLYKHTYTQGQKDENRRIVEAIEHLPTNPGMATPDYFQGRADMKEDALLVAKIEEECI